LCALHYAFTHAATSEISTLSLHDALPICPRASSRRLAAQRRLEDAVDAEDAPDASEGEAEERQREQRPDPVPLPGHVERAERDVDRKSTRLNSSHDQISYAVFCLKKKTTK